MDAFNLGKTIRLLAVLDGALLLINCAFVPVLFLLLLWVRLSLFAFFLLSEPGLSDRAHGELSLRWCRRRLRALAKLPP